MSGAEGRAQTVLFFSDLAILGGGEVCMVALVRALDRARFRPVVVAPERGPLTEALAEAGVSWEAMKFFERMRAWRLKKHLYLHVHWRLRANLRRLRELLERERVEVLHTHGGMYPENIRHLGRVARAAGIPVVWTCGYGATYPREVAAREIAPWVDRVIAVSQAVRERLLATGAFDPRAIEVIHHGLDLEEWPAPRAAEREALRAELGAGPEEVLFGIVGRVVRIKGHQTFLEAAAALAARSPAARFVVVGDQRPVETSGGEFMRHLRAESRRLGLEDRVRFAGWREDVGAVMAALDVLVQPSLEEAFGRTLLEAMALGRPVVAARTGGMPEVVEEGATGLLVPPRDAAALAAAMERLAGDAALRAGMGRAGRARVEERFSLARGTRRVEAIYRGVMDDAAASRAGSAA